MSAEQHYGAHSAQVEMRLIINGTTIGITHMGPDFRLVKSPAASIFLKVDDSESEWKVRLPEGISKDSNRVALALTEQSGQPPKAGASR